MLVLIKSAPDTPDAKRALKLASEMAAGLVLLQNGVYFTVAGRLEGFGGDVYALEDDLSMRGIDAPDKGVKAIGYAELVDLLAANNKVTGMF